MSQKWNLLEENRLKYIQAPITAWIEQHAVGSVATTSQSKRRRSG